MACLKMVFDCLWVVVDVFEVVVEFFEVLEADCKSFLHLTLVTTPRFELILRSSSKRETDVLEITTFLPSSDSLLSYVE